MALSHRQRASLGTTSSTTSAPQVPLGRPQRRGVKQLTCSAVLQSQPNIRSITDLQQGVFKDIKTDGELQLELRDVKVGGHSTTAPAEAATTRHKVPIKALTTIWCGSAQPMHIQLAALLWQAIACLPQPHMWCCDPAAAASAAEC